MVVAGEFLLLLHDNMGVGCLKCDITVLYNVHFIHLFCCLKLADIPQLSHWQNRVKSELNALKSKVVVDDNENVDAPYYVLPFGCLVDRLIARNASFWRRKATALSRVVALPHRSLVQRLCATQNS